MVIKTLDPDRYSLKMLNPDPDKMNTDPKHWYPEEVSLCRILLKPNGWLIPVIFRLGLLFPCYICELVFFSPFSFYRHECIMRYIRQARLDSVPPPPPDQSQGREQSPPFPIGSGPGQCLSFLLLLVTRQRVTNSVVSYWS